MDERETDEGIREEKADPREDGLTARDADGSSGGTAGGSASGQGDGSSDENGAGEPESDALGTLRAESAALREELERIRGELDRAKEALEAAEEEKGRAESERDEALRREGMRIREAALRRYLDGVGLSGDAAELAMRGLKAETEALCLNEDGGLAEDSRAAGRLILPRCKDSLSSAALPGLFHKKLRRGSGGYAGGGLRSVRSGALRCSPLPSG